MRAEPDPVTATDLDLHLRTMHDAIVARPQDMRRVHRELHSRSIDSDNHSPRWKPHTHQEDA